MHVSFMPTSLGTLLCQGFPFTPLNGGMKEGFRFYRDIRRLQRILGLSRGGKEIAQIAKVRF